MGSPHSAQPEKNRKSYPSLFAGRPNLLQDLHERVNGITAMLANVSLYRGPGVEVTGKLAGCPLKAELQIRAGNFFKRKKDVPVVVIDELSCGIPVRTRLVLIKIHKQFINFLIDAQQRITPHRQQSSWHGGAFYLFVEIRQVEPVEGLADSDQVELMIRESGVFRRSNGVVNIPGPESVIELLPADVCGVYLVKMAGEMKCYLTITGGAIPGGQPSVKVSENKLKKGFRIRGPESSILFRLPGKIIFLLHKGCDHQSRL